MNPLDTPVTVLSGVGDAKAKLFAKLRISTLYDAVRHFPRDYEDRTVMRFTAQLEHGESVCVAATVEDATMTRSANGLMLVKARAHDDYGALDLYFFNQPYARDALRRGETYIFFGKVERETRTPRMVNPVFERYTETRQGTRTRCIVPVYRLTSGLSQYAVSTAVRAALTRLRDKLPDPTPPYIAERYDLVPAQYAYEQIHFPQDFDTLAAARRRLIFDELLTVAAAAQRSRLMRERVLGRRFADTDLAAFFGALPFALTDGQTAAICDCVRDITSGNAMSRLVQGDVGCGKTVVAMAMCYLAVRNGAQAAFMAPTELLAEQHYRTFIKILEPLGIRVTLLTGALTKKRRETAHAAIALGETDIVIGTHALISEGVTFFDLALVVADEQHRFGVEQRAKLTAKGDSPHVLVMSATPIPRTLALILYGDLDVSTIRDKPPGRRPVRTYVYRESQREKLYNSVRRLIAEGRQAYIICPAVEESDDPDGSDLKSVKAYHAQLSETVFPDIAVGLVYGSMKPRDKDAAMRGFASGDTRILVATTVVEVGVDVANAALIVVENADRFGLSQLHQLRGRVGRGEHDSFCVLFEGAGGETARERLNALVELSDGFEIAERDLAQRGPGDFFGLRQSGLPMGKFAGAFSDTELVTLARDAAETILTRDPELEMAEHKALRGVIERMVSEAERTFN